MTFYFLNSILLLVQPKFIVSREIEIFLIVFQNN